MVIELDKLDYIYDRNTVMEKEAVRGVSIRIEKGDFVSVIGSTGCGKSTLLSLIAGLEKPKSGTVKVNESVGMMSQFPECQLFAQTVLEDVMYGPKNIGMNSEAAEKAAADALNLVKIDSELFKTKPSSLSGGQKRKVAIAGILAMKRSVLLFDEPTVGLDRISAYEIMETISNLNKEGCTVIIATNDSEIALKYSSRVVVMNDGRIVADTCPADIIEQSETMEEYGIDIPEIYKIEKKLRRSDAKSKIIKYLDKVLYFRN